jgi:hypothetical protein
MSPLCQRMPGARMRKSKSNRLREQRERQAAYRAEQNATRRPDRDHVARVALWWLITSMESRSRKTGNRRTMNKILDEIIAALVEQGFDEGQSEDVVDALVRKYGSGWAFQRKTHLRAVDTG